MLEIIRIERLLGVAAQDHGAVRQPEAVESVRYALMQGPGASREVKNREHWKQARAPPCDFYNCLRRAGESIYIVSFVEEGVIQRLHMSPLLSALSARFCNAGPRYAILSRN